jgi:hypothetical protein
MQTKLSGVINVCFEEEISYGSDLLSSDGPTGKIMHVQFYHSLHKLLTDFRVASSYIVRREVL